jgi:peptidoglycan/LPS O-acetylase OafA/YrhL
MATPTQDNEQAPLLTPLNGVRFFAVFHIFLFHMWAVKHPDSPGEGPPAQFAEVFGVLNHLPWWLDRFLAHGYVSTTFFFALSGFILSYLYWSPSGELATTKRRFWWARLSRVYPAHLIALAITSLLMLPRFVFDPLAPSIPLAAASLVATTTLTQAWFPPLVPIWAWPTWALSALVFLYLIMPWLMSTLARLTRKQMWAVLAALPVVSLVPTLLGIALVPDFATASLNLKTFIGSTPLFWVPTFVAGMLLSRLLGISRFEQKWRDERKSWLALGDLAFLGLVAVCLLEPHPVWRHVLRHGLLLPLYLLVIRDFALGKGLFARAFSLPGMDFFGQTSFSIFIWQGFLTAVGFIVAFVSPAAVAASFWISTIGLIVVATISTYWLEKPLAKRLRKRFDAREKAAKPLGLVLAS